MLLARAGCSRTQGVLGRACVPNEFAEQGEWAMQPWKCICAEGHAPARHNWPCNKARNRLHALPERVHLLPFKEGDASSVVFFARKSFPAPTLPRAHLGSVGSRAKCWLVIMSAKRGSAKLGLKLAALRAAPSSAASSSLLVVRLALRFCRGGAGGAHSGCSTARHLRVHWSWESTLTYLWAQALTILERNFPQGSGDAMQRFHANCPHEPSDSTQIAQKSPATPCKLPTRAQRFHANCPRAQRFHANCP